MFRSLLICIFFLIEVYPVFAEERIPLEQQVLDKIDVEVYASCLVSQNDPKLLARLKTKQGHYFRQQLLDEDLKLLAQEFDRLEPVLEPVQDGLHLTLKIWQKPQLNSVKVMGNRQIPTKTLQKEMGIVVHQTFDRVAFQEAFAKIQTLYMKKGFFEADLSYEVAENRDKHQVDVTITIREGRSGKIEEISLIGFTPEEERQVLKQMVTKEFNRFTFLFTEDGIYNKEAVEHDRLLVTHSLQNLGYADASVGIRVEKSAKKNRIRVVIEANKGERYSFGTIAFAGNQFLSDPQVEELLLIRTGQPFSHEKVRANANRLQDAYGKHGYIETVVDFQLELVPEKREYNVHFDVEEGDLYRVGLIRVFGNRITQSSVILHETLLTPGDVFNMLKLKATEEKLLNMGYFKHVNAYAAKNNEQTGLDGCFRDIYIEVEEMETGYFNFFFGYSTSEELFGGISLTEKNFNIAGVPEIGGKGLSALRGAGEYVNLNAQIGQKSSNYDLSWTKPHFLDTQWTVGLDLSQSTTRYISNAYDLSTTAFTVRTSYDLNAFLRWGVQYRLKNGSVDLHDISSSSDRSQSDDSSSSDSDSDSANSSLEEASRIHGLISAVGTSLSYDSTNRPMRPNRGFRSRLLLECAGLGGDHTFLGFGYFNSLYYPVGSRATLKYRADFRFIQPIGNTHVDNMPLDERLFLGGEFEVRGYRPYRLGPQFGHSKVPSGGVSLQYYSIELNRRLTQDVEVFTFFDAASLSEETWEMGRLSASVGYGVYFKLIPSIPPITMGMGYPINPRNHSEVRRFFFSVGGNF